MRGLFIKNKTDKITISALNYYGGNFKLSVFNPDTNSFVFHNIQMTEGIEPVEELSTTNDEEREAGVESLKFKDITGYNINDRIKLNNDDEEIYRIVSIDENTNEVQLHKGIKKTIPFNATIERVGNTGLYYCDLGFPEEGTFTVKGSCSVHGLQRTDSIKVVSQTQARQFTIMA